MGVRSTRNDTSVRPNAFANTKRRKKRRIDCYNRAIKVISRRNSFGRRIGNSNEREPKHISEKNTRLWSGCAPLHVVRQWYSWPFHQLRSQALFDNTTFFNTNWKAARFTLNNCDKFMVDALTVPPIDHDRLADFDRWISVTAAWRRFRPMKYLSICCWPLSFRWENRFLPNLWFITNVMRFVRNRRVIESIIGRKTEAGAQNCHRPGSK